MLEAQEVKKMGRRGVRQLFCYRTGIAAIVNAGMTWIVLIIAPLGLFAVILSTLLVFLGSLTTGAVSDRLLLGLLEPELPLQVGAERVNQQGRLNREEGQKRLPEED